MAPVAEVAACLPGASPAYPSPHLEVTYISEKTWDEGVVVWSTNVEAGAVPDQILRSVLASLLSFRPA